MKATGIVRRIDDLGRVVIPKEIRRTMRIREGDPLEIYTDSNGEVIFKKYSPIGELEPYTKQYADIIHKTSELVAIICDCDHVVAVSGMPKKEVIDKKISGQVEQLIQNRELYCNNPNGETSYLLADNELKISVLMPIIGAGDVMGAVILISSEENFAPNQIQIKIAQVAAGFLGKQMED